MLYCTATAISEPVFVPCEPGEEHPKRSKPWLVIWPASSTECSRAGRHLSTAAYRNMKTGARNVNSRLTVQSRGSRIQACQRSEPCVTVFLSRNFQRTQSSSWRDLSFAVQEVTVLSRERMQIDPGNLKPGQAEMLALSYSVLAKSQEDLQKVQR